MNDALQAAFLGAMQTEIGVLKSNLILRDLQFEDAQRGIESRDALIEALKTRVQEAERARDALRAQIQPKRGKPHGPNAA